MNFFYEKLKNLNNAKDIYSISNDKSARKFSVNTKKFSYASHLSWLKKIIKKKNENIFLVKSNKKIIGIIRVKKKQKNLNDLSWGLKKSFRGKRLGKKMLKNFVKKFKSKYCAKIKRNNHASIKICNHAGFDLSIKRKEYNYYKN